jgi:hypothetical protein
MVCSHLEGGRFLDRRRGIGCSVASYLLPYPFSPFDSREAQDQNEVGDIGQLKNINLGTNVQNMPPQHLYKRTSLP